MFYISDDTTREKLERKFSILKIKKISIILSRWQRMKVFLPDQTESHFRFFKKKINDFILREKKIEKLNTELVPCFTIKFTLNIN